MLTIGFPYCKDSTFERIMARCQSDGGRMGQHTEQARRTGILHTVGRRAVQALPRHGRHALCRTAARRDPRPCRGHTAQREISERLTYCDADHRGSCADGWETGWNESNGALMALEIPGIYVRTDKDSLYVFDHVEARIAKADRKRIVLSVSNPTAFDATVTVLAEDGTEAARPPGRQCLCGLERTHQGLGRADRELHPAEIPLTLSRQGQDKEPDVTVRLLALTLLSRAAAHHDRQATRSV